MQVSDVSSISGVVNRLIASTAAGPARQTVSPPRSGPTGPAEARGPANSTSRTSREPDRFEPSSQLEQLTPEERREVERLQARDREVRAHEEAHKAAAGSLARGGPTYEFTEGPDGRRYAVGGHVNIDTSPGRTPEQTVAKAQRIRRAALAPAEPSSADRSVAAKASRMEAEARQELAQRRVEARSGDAGETRAAGSSEDGPRVGGLVDILA